MLSRLKFFVKAMDDNYGTAVVIDNGSGTLKAGLSGEDYPQIFFHNFIGKPRERKVKVRGKELKDTYVGESAQCRREILRIRYPMEHGIVTNWDDMERVWQYTLDQLSVNPAERKVLLSEAPLNPRCHREKMTQVMFESFGAPSIYVANHAVLSMLGVGRHMSIIIDSGDGVTHITPIIGIYRIPGACQRLDIGGRDLTQYLAKLLSENGYFFTTPNEMEIVRSIKEKHCFVIPDADKEIPAVAKQLGFLKKTYRLPDGEDVTVLDESYRCPEGLFQPSMLGVGGKGIHQMTFDSLMKCDIDLRSDLCVNFVLAGGNTMYPGFAHRMQKELTALIPATRRVRVVDTADRNYLAFTGGSLWASLSSFQPDWITKEEYEESGPAISHRKV